MGLPAADDFPSADYPSLDSADYPSLDSADYPSLDLGPAESYATGDQPLAGFAVPGDEATDDSGARPDSRRRAAQAPAGSRSRSRQRGKRDDDDDWPSSEWDKLSDEQYWAELSADKPLSAMARPSRPTSDAAATVPAPRKSRLAGAPAAGRDPRRDLPSLSEHAGEREPVTRPGEREPVTEHLPVAEHLPIRTAPQAPPALRDAATAVGPSYPESRSALDSASRSSRDPGPYQAGNTGPHAVWDTGPQRRPGRRRQDTIGPQPTTDPGLAMLTGHTTGPQPTTDPGLAMLTEHTTRPQPRPGRRRQDTIGPQPTTDPGPAMVTGPASASQPIPGALVDDPLTSPSFSLRAVPASDSRSYSNARKHAKTTPAAGLPAAYGAAHGNGHGADGYSTGHRGTGQAGPGLGYQQASPPGTADWYSAPPGPTEPPAGAATPSYGNPYAYTGSGNGGATGAHAGTQATESYHNYTADPLRVYAAPGYDTPGYYAEAGGPAGAMAAQPLPAGGTPYGDGYPVPPYAGQPGYADRFGTGGYAPGYEEGYAGDPYASGGYAPYPFQG